jgi:hypothetical protein
MAYMGADGKPTSDWSKTKQFAEGTEQAKKEKASLRQLQYENAKFNATSDQITDPHAQAAGLRGLAQYDKEAALAVTAADKAADAAYKQGDLKIKAAGVENTARAQEIAAKKDWRDFKAGQSKEVLAHTAKLLDTHAPTDGLKDEALTKAQKHRADLEQAYFAGQGEMPTDTIDYAAKAPRTMNQAKLSVAFKNAIENRGWMNKLGNLGHDPWTTLNAVKPTRDGDDFRFPNGFTIPVKDVIGKDADLLTAYNERLKAK